MPVSLKIWTWGVGRTIGSRQNGLVWWDGVLGGWDLVLAGGLKMLAHIHSNSSCVEFLPILFLFHSSFPKWTEVKFLQVVVSEFHNYRIYGISFLRNIHNQSLVRQ